MEHTAMSKDHTGMQIRVWISEDVYGLLKARARNHGTSVAEEARRLMQLGLAEGMTWEQFDAALDHLERLAYDTAVNARLLTKVEESKARLSFKHQNTGQSDMVVMQNFRRQWGQLRQEAVDGLARYLRDNDDPEGGE
nr:hypothetical protein [Sulfobacillus thermotolerans]